MRKLNLDDPEVGLVQPDKPQDRFKVIVEFTVKSDSADDAQEDVKDIVGYGILGLIDREDREPIDDFDIIEAEPAEIL
jgi:hypothetical protein